MTKAELFAAMSDVPDDARIVVDGYEGGLDEPHVLFGSTALLDYENEGGIYEDLGQSADAVEPDSFPVVCLSRGKLYDWHFQTYAEAVAAVEERDTQGEGPLERR